MSAAEKPAEAGFSTDLEFENTVAVIYDGGSSLLLNPDAPTLVLVGSALARLQALQGWVDTLLTCGDINVDPHEYLRGMGHLTQETTMLVDAIQSRLDAERRKL
jgi:hypothetical protein